MSCERRPSGARVRRPSGCGAAGRRAEIPRCPPAEHVVGCELIFLDHVWHLGPLTSSNALLSHPEGPPRPPKGLKGYPRGQNSLLSYFGPCRSPDSFSLIPVLPPLQTLPRGRDGPPKPSSVSPPPEGLPTFRPPAPPLQAHLQAPPPSPSQRVARPPTLTLTLTTKIIVTVTNTTVVSITLRMAITVKPK